MPLHSIGPVLRRAQEARYGVAAFNVIDYNSARAIVDGAQELGAPVICQLSTKTIRLWGYRPIAGWVRSLAEDADVPVCLHLDHCSDIAVIERCIEAGWTSVMFDGSLLPFEENLAQTKRVYEMTESAGVGLEAEIGAIGGVEDDKFVAEDESILADFDECVRFTAEMPNLSVFAPAIGTAHGFYAGEPRIAYDLLERITAAIEVPIALHGGTGLSREQFDRCIGAGCAKVNISTMHKRDFIDGFADLRKEKPKLGEPIPFIEAQHARMKAGVMEMIRQFGSEGRAAHAAG